ncbi:hypothetical protein DID88_010348 [Monilinia fructigena]|uniref:Uncharacterized protein n=1 Tax=Monilinia fructigena TaxID=38457 RepID=A0A395ISD9_9HELO|nr:hypothetical protein DID88_010348 [Monilinia fructigena]
MSFFFNSPISENTSGNLGTESSSQNDVQQHMSGPKSNIYLPPSTPSASATSSLYLFDTRSTTSTDMLNGGGTMVGRKRMRDSLPYEYGYERGNQFDDGDSNLLTPGSPMPFVNTKYRLAGGLDTPQADIQNRELERESDYGDIKYRRELSDVKESFEMDGNDSGGWIKPALNVVGGVVGKVWEFCKMGVAFKGFQAGGGNGYVFGTTTPIAPVAMDDSKENVWEDEKSPGTPVIGRCFNGWDGGELYGSTLCPDDMSRNWVVVPQPPPQPDYPLVQQYPTLPPVPADAFAIPQSQASRPRLSQQRSGIARYSMPTTTTSSRRHLASPQITSSNMGAARRPNYPTTRTLNPSPNLSNYGNNKLRNPSRTNSSHIPRTSSPGGSRIPRWTPNTKQLREEREQDEMMRKFDRQLKDLIRQGTQALGTTVADMEIDDDDVFDGRG